MVLLSILISQALVLHVIERAIPVPVPVPGVKLGLANIISLITIILFGFKEAIIVVTIRTLLGSLFGGGLSVYVQFGRWVVEHFGDGLYVFEV